MIYVKSIHSSSNFVFLRYFLNLLFYALVSLLVATCMTFANWNYLSIACGGVVEDGVKSSSSPYILVFMSAFQVMSCFSVGGFLTFQIYLALSGMTTIEYCEYRRNAQIISWSQGRWEDLQNVLGENPMCWPCPSPCGSVPGDGLRFKGGFKDASDVPLVKGRLLSAGGMGGAADVE